MRTGVSKPEKNGGASLTIPARCTSPLEAYRSLNMGHPIDQAVGYYEKSGIVEPDFYMMDKIGKLQKLAEYKELVLQHKSDIDQAVSEANKRQEEEKFNVAVEAAAAKRVIKNNDNNGNTKDIQPEVS